MANLLAVYETVVAARGFGHLADAGRGFGLDFDREGVHLEADRPKGDHLVGAGHDFDRQDVRLVGDRPVGVVHDLDHGFDREGARLVGGRPADAGCD